MVEIERIAPSPNQPRKRFDEVALRQLAESIQSQGIIQPIVVTSATRDGTQRSGQQNYQILAGERRWRAAQIAGLHDVPVFIRNTPEHERLELALVENLQRADLNPIEEAEAYERLIEEHGYTQEQLGSRVGRERSTITNSLRLLRLPPKVRGMVSEGLIGNGHARALLGLERESEIAELASEVVRRKMSVRAVEAEVKRRHAPTREPNEDERRRNIIVQDLEQKLRASLGVQARLKPSKKKADGPGRIEIPYKDLDELDRLLQVVLATQN